MASTDKTLVDLFPWLGSDEVLKNLRLLMQAIEGRISPLEADRVGYVETIATLRDLATRRIAEVLDPAEEALRGRVSVGFSADKITDSTPAGRAILKGASYAALKEALAITLSDIEGALNGDNPQINGGKLTDSELVRPTIRLPAIQGGTFGNPALTGATIKELAATANGEEAASAAFVRKLLKDVTDAYAKSVLRYDVEQALPAVQRALATANVIGFSPVEQGNGIGQDPGTAHKIKIGWADGRLRATIDETDTGGIWCDKDSPRSVHDTGWQRLPSGLYLQWGNADCTPDQNITFPLAFPNQLIGVYPALLWGTAENEGWMLTYLNHDRFGFTARPRRYANGSLGPGPTILLKYFALGY